MAHDVFISYSSKDKAVADGIVASLEKNGIRCWYAPRDIKPSDNWGEAIIHAIDNNRIFLLIFSGHANHSQHVLDEVLYAINKQRTILPFRIENLNPEGAMSLHLSSRHWLDAYDPSWEPYLKELIMDVSNILDTELHESDVQVDESIALQTKGTSRRKIIPILGIIAIIALIIAGWFIVPRLFPKDDIPNQEVTMAASTTTAETIPSKTPTASVSGLTPKPTQLTVTPTSIIRDANLNLAMTENILSFDPIGVPNPYIVKNIFIRLVAYDQETGQIIPAAAKSWSISPDGKLYTFKIRQDIPWVTHILGGETEQVLDENGEKRFVTAQDFVYAIQQLCLIGWRGYSPPNKIKGCNEIRAYEEPQNTPESLFNELGVKAVSEFELLIELNEPSSEFLTTILGPQYTPRPTWAVEKYGEAWANPGNIQTTGNYVIDQFNLDESSYTLVRNELLPEDLAGSGNVGTINILFDLTEVEQYELWKNGQLDISPIPDDMVSEHLEQYSPDQVLPEEAKAFTFFYLNISTPPFDNVHVRRAFAAAIDKETYVNEFLGETSSVINDFVISSNNIAAPTEDLDVLNFDPDFAKDSLAEGGYPNCEGLPTITYNNWTKLIQLPEQVIRDWERTLGCPENTILIDNESRDFGYGDFQLIGSGSPSGVPFDQNSIYNTYIWCIYNFPDTCIETDELIAEARQTLNLEDRTNLNAQIEEAEFGFGGDFRVIPLLSKRKFYALSELLELSTYNTNLYDWQIDIDPES